MLAVRRSLALSLVLAVGLFIGLAACDDGIVDPDPDPDPDPVQDDEPLPELPGDPDDSVLEATYDFSADVEITDAEVSMDPDTGAEIVRTYVEVEIGSNVSVSEVNDLLKKFEAKIALMLNDRPFLGLQIPDRHNLDSVRELIADIADENIVEGAQEAGLSAPDVLPDHIAPVEDNIGNLN